MPQIIKLNKYYIRTIRYGRKTKTIVEGLEDDLDMKYIAKCVRKQLKCSAVAKHDNENNVDVLILQGHMANDIKKWLVDEEIAREDELVFKGI